MNKINAMYVAYKLYECVILPRFGVVLDSTKKILAEKMVMIGYQFHYAQ